MSHYLLHPRVICREFTLLTSGELNKLLKNLKSKKLGIKEYAVDVEEVEQETSFQRIEHGRVLKPGKYYNVHLEYIA